jgi:tRNA(fMet)-specific endonuclease VapC
VKYLVDSDWLIDAAAGRPLAVRTLDRLSSDGLATSIVSVAEIYEGAFGTPDPEATLKVFREFLGAFAILPLSDATVERFARLRAILRREGRLLPDMDLMIAATALEEDLSLVTRNLRHFGRIPGLHLYQLA